MISTHGNWGRRQKYIIEEQWQHQPTHLSRILLSLATYTTQLYSTYNHSISKKNSSVLLSSIDQHYYSSSDSVIQLPSPRPVHRSTNLNKHKVETKSQTVQLPTTSSISPCKFYTPDKIEQFRENIEKAKFKKSRIKHELVKVLMNKKLQTEDDAVDNIDIDCWNNFHPSWCAS